MTFFEKHQKLFALNFSAVLIFVSAALIRSLPISVFDSAFSEFVSANMVSTLATSIMLFVSTALHPVGLFVLALILALVLFSKGRMALAATFAFAIFASVVSAVILKDLFAIARPIEYIVPEIGWSFPSLHATVVAAFFFSFLYVLGERAYNHAVVILWSTVAGIFLLTLGASRIYLGAHWFSDVIAGFALGTFWATLSILFFEINRHNRDRKHSNAKS